MLAATNCSFIENSAQGGTGGSSGREGAGGALYNAGTATLVNCQITSNHVFGGGGSYRSFPQSQGQGGGVANEGNLVSLGSTFNGNSAQGGSGLVQGFPAMGSYTGSDGLGGAIFNGVTFFATNSTFFGNQAYGGSGDYLGGNGFGGPLNNDRKVVLGFCTLSFNLAFGGHGATNGTGFGNGLFTDGTTPLDSCLVANNSPGANNFGPLVDGGHNLCSDASCAFTGLGSLNNTDPMLSSLSDNGGPTLTCASLQGSPAIDGGNPASAPTTDQRGEPRLAGFGPDIGAFEFGSAPLRIREGRTNNTLILTFPAKAYQEYRLLVSDDLSHGYRSPRILATRTGVTQFARHHHIKSGGVLSVSDAVGWLDPI